AHPPPGTAVARDTRLDSTASANPRTPRRRSARHCASPTPPDGRCSAHASLHWDAATATLACGCRGSGSIGINSAFAGADSADIEFWTLFSSLIELRFEQVAERLDQRFTAAATAHDHRERRLITES